MAVKFKSFFNEISRIASRSRRLGYPTTLIEIAVFLSILVHVPEEACQSV